MDCLFCAIVRGEIPSDKVFENEHVLAFRDIHPQAPVHVLIIPKTHVASADDVTAEETPLISEIFLRIPEIAKSCGLTKGYRIVTNVGEDGCQSVKHLHFHLLGGEKLSDSMA